MVGLPLQAWGPIGVFWLGPLTWQWCREWPGDQVTWACPVISPTKPSTPRVSSKAASVYLFLIYLQGPQQHIKSLENVVQDWLGFRPPHSSHLISSHLGNILNLKLYFIIQVTDKNIHSNPQSLFITHQESSSTCTGRKNKKRKEKKVEKRDGGSRG